MVMSEYTDPITEAHRLRAQGLTMREIGERLGRQRSTVAAWINDPDGSKQRERHKRYGGTCERCGARTTGCNGRAKAPKLCAECTRQSKRAEHGTRTRYLSGCSCDDCRRASREYQRTLKGKPPPSHGHSGYVNYGCRCDVCTRANTEYSYGYLRRWRLKQKAASA